MLSWTRGKLHTMPRGCRSLRRRSACQRSLRRSLRECPPLPPISSRVSPVPIPPRRLPVFGDAFARGSMGSIMPSRAGPSPPEFHPMDFSIRNPLLSSSSSFFMPLAASRMLTEGPRVLVCTQQALKTAKRTQGRAHVMLVPARPLCAPADDARSMAPTQIRQRLVHPSNLSRILPPLFHPPSCASSPVSTQQILASAEYPAPPHRPEPLAKEFKA